MAGAGYKLFNTGDVLTAAQVNTYLQEQAVMRFANAAARTTALSGVLAEGMVSYLDDTNQLEVYDGSTWTSASGDITAVTAGTGISGGGTSGAVTITNSMATAIDAKGDLIVGTGADTFSRLAVSATNGHFLKVNSATSTGLEWGAGAASPAWTTYTPTWTNLTVGNGTNTGRYYDDGINVELMVEIIFGSTTSISGTVKFSLPVNASSRQMFLMGGRLLDSGSADCIPIVQIESATTAVAYWPNIDEVLSGQNYLTARTISSTVPWTWATNDRIQVYFTYEKA